MRKDRNKQDCIKDLTSDACGLFYIVGLYCESDLCSGEVAYCMNGGTCSVNSKGEAQCQCSIGYYGNNCSEGKHFYVVLSNTTKEWDSFHLIERMKEIYSQGQMQCSFINMLFNTQNKTISCWIVEEC